MSPATHPSPRFLWLGTLLLLGAAALCFRFRTDLPASLGLFAYLGLATDGRTMAGLFCWIAGTFLAVHLAPKRFRSAGLAGSGLLMICGSFGFPAALTLLLYHVCAFGLLRKPAIELSHARRWAGTLWLQLPLLVPLAFTLWPSAYDPPLGAAWLLFGVHYLRMLMLSLEWRDGLTAGMTFGDYLVIFFCPALLPSFYFGGVQVQAYQQLREAEARGGEAERLRRAALLLALSVMYFAASAGGLSLMVSYLRELGWRGFTGIQALLAAAEKGDALSAGGVWSTVLIDQIAFFFFFTAIAHLRVALWNLLGYSLRPDVSWFWTATNFLDLWPRYSYYLSEFLRRVCFFPAFLRLRATRIPLAARGFLAVLVSVAGGSLLVHVYLFALNRGGLTNGAIVLQRWPFYLLLALGIGATMAFRLRWPRARRPWTLDRYFALDVLGWAFTIGMLCLIHLFARTSGTVSQATQWRVFLAAFGG